MTTVIVRSSPRFVQHVDDAVNAPRMASINIVVFMDSLAIGRRWWACDSDRFQLLARIRRWPASRLRYPACLWISGENYSLQAGSLGFC